MNTEVTVGTPNNRYFSLPAPTISGHAHGRAFVQPAAGSFAHEDDSIAKIFRRLALKWERETKFYSSPAERYLHPSYARIIGMGSPALKLILKDMQRRYADWFFALRAITGANPVTDDMAGDVERMTKAWLQWGRTRGVL